MPNSRYGIPYHVWGVICRANGLKIVIRSFGPSAHVQFLRAKLPCLSHIAFSRKQDLRISSMPSLLGSMFFFFILRDASGSLVSATCHVLVGCIALESSSQHLHNWHCCCVGQWPVFRIMSKLSWMFLYINGQGVHRGFPLRSRDRGRRYFEMVLSFR